jgi:hypothetical protein
MRPWNNSSRPRILTNEPDSPYLSIKDGIPIIDGDIKLFSPQCLMHLFNFTLKPPLLLKIP